MIDSKKKCNNPKNEYKIHFSLTKKRIVANERIQAY